MGTVLFPYFFNFNFFNIFLIGHFCSCISWSVVIAAGSALLCLWNGIMEKFECYRFGADRSNRIHWYIILWYGVGQQHNSQDKFWLFMAHSVYTTHIQFYVPDRSVYTRTKNEIWQRIRTVRSNLRCSPVKLYRTLLYWKNTAVAEMATFKEASFDIISFDKKAKAEKVSIHLAAVAEDSKWLEYNKEEQNSLPVILKFSWLRRY